MNVNGIRVLGLSCQPHIDLVLISDDWRPRIHFEGANAIGSVDGTRKVVPPRDCCRIHISRTRNFPDARFCHGLYTIEFTANPCIAFCSYMNAVSFS